MWFVVRCAACTVGRRALENAASSSLPVLHKSRANAALYATPPWSVISSKCTTQQALGRRRKGHQKAAESAGQSAPKSPEIGPQLPAFSRRQPCPSRLTSKARATYPNPAPQSSRSSSRQKPFRLKQRCHPPANLLADRTHLLDRLSLRVGQWPVLAAHARHMRTRLAASHRNQHRRTPGELLRPAAAPFRQARCPPRASPPPPSGAPPPQAPSRPRSRAPSSHPPANGTRPPTSVTAPHCARTQRETSSSKPRSRSHHTHRKTHSAKQIYGSPTHLSIRI